jgi:hypothetical protein
LSIARPEGVIVTVGADESFGQVTWKVIPWRASFWSKPPAADLAAAPRTATERTPATSDLIHDLPDHQARTVRPPAESQGEPRTVPRALPAGNPVPANRGVLVSIR